jgi:hypothetical protein
VSGTLAADLGIGPGVWLFLSLIGCVTLFFKFSRVWSVRNLDLLLLFAVAPGLMMLVPVRHNQPWVAFALLFLGAGLWMVRCLVDLGLSRRPLLEPNMNMAGLACLAVGILGLLLAETVTLRGEQGVARNPADPGTRVEPPPPGSQDANATVNKVLQVAPLPSTLKPLRPEVVLSRVLAALAHMGLVAGLIAVGWWHFDRPIIGLAMATCYLIMPYTRIALVDSGQVLPSALIVGALVYYDRPALAGALIGLAAGWMPACLGLVALWTGFYRGRGAGRFLVVGVSATVACAVIGHSIPGMAAWARAVGARSLAEVGLLPGAEATGVGSFWGGVVDENYRLPVLIGYVGLVAVAAFFPTEKNLGELIALSAALLVGCQFWYLAEGGTLVMLYLPMILLMMFRPTLIAKRPILREPRGRPSQATLFHVR